MTEITKLLTKYSLTPNFLGKKGNRTAAPSISSKGQDINRYVRVGFFQPSCPMLSELQMSSEILKMHKIPFSTSDMLYRILDIAKCCAE